jgi:hypothetical protein
MRSGGLGAGVVCAASFSSVNQANKGVMTVQTAKVAKQDSLISLVASGEIKPTTYTNVQHRALAESPTFW